MAIKEDRIEVIRHLIASIFALQKALRNLAPEFRWAGLGNLLGDFGELIAVDHYGLEEAPRGADGYDAITENGKTVQIKTNFAASQIGFRGQADLLLVISINEDGSWEELYYGDFATVRNQSTYSERDNKHMISVNKLRTKFNDKTKHGESSQ